MVILKIFVPNGQMKPMTKMFEEGKKNNNNANNTHTRREAKEVFGEKITWRLKTNICFKQHVHCWILFKLNLKHNYNFHQSRWMQQQLHVCSIFSHSWYKTRNKAFIFHIGLLKTLSWKEVDDACQENGVGNNFINQSSIKGIVQLIKFSAIFFFWKRWQSFFNFNVRYPERMLRVPRHNEDPLSDVKSTGQCFLSPAKSEPSLKLFRNCQRSKDFSLSGAIGRVIV